MTEENQMSKTAVTFVLILVAAVVSAGELKTVILQPDQAATISGETDEGIDPRILLSFDLSSIPEAAHIQSAGLALSAAGSVPWNHPFVPVMAGALTKQWNPESADWSGPDSGHDWDTPGGDWNPEFTSYRVIVRGARAPSRIRIAHLVDAWKDGNLRNNGLIVMLQDVADLQDINQTFNAEALKPSLKIRYSLTTTNY
jgi:hypothetical protein